MDAVTLHRRTVEEWTSRVAAVRSDQWGLPTPCTDWDVRALVNHVAGEDRWTQPLLEGRTIAEVGDSLDGDLLGDDPAGAASLAAAQAVAAAEYREVVGAVVHLSYGDEDAAEYLRQLAADHLVHAWDLATATDGDRELDPDLATEIIDWFDAHKELYRAAGIVAPPVEGEFDTPQDRLIAASGRHP